MTRILALDRASGALTGEYAYVMEPFGAFDPGAVDQTDMKISGIVALTADRLLVLERTDAVARVYAVDLHAATNLLGTRWDDPATVPSLEAAPDLAAAGVTALPKSLVLDLGGLPAMPAKIEGIAVVDANTLAFANDNDFDLGGFDSAGNNQPGGVANEIAGWRLEIAALRPRLLQRGDLEITGFDAEAQRCRDSQRQHDNEAGLFSAPQRRFGNYRIRRRGPEMQRFAEVTRQRSRAFLCVFLCASASLRQECEFPNGL